MRAALLLAIPVLGAIAVMLLQTRQDAPPPVPRTDASVTSERPTPKTAKGIVIAGDAAPAAIREAAAQPPDADAAATGGPTLVVHVVHLPPGDPRATLRLVTQSGDGDRSQILGAEAIRHGAELVATFAPPANTSLRLESTLRLGDGNPAFGPVHDLRLTPHEQKHVTLEFGALEVELHLTGPSRDLLPYLDLTAQWHEEQARAEYAFHLTPDGTARLRCNPGTLEVAVVLVPAGETALYDADGESRLDPGAGPLELHADEALVGIVVRHGDAEFQSALDFLPPDADETLRACSTVTRDEIEGATVVHARVDGLGMLCCAVDRLQRTGDLWVLDPAQAQHMGHVHVTLRDRPDGANFPGLFAVALDGTSTCQLDGRRRADLLVGTWRLHWAQSGQLGPIASEPFVIRGNETTELEVIARPRQHWRARLRGQPPPERLLLACDGSYSYGTSQDGTFEIDLDVAPGPGSSCTIVTGALPAEFAAQVVDVDPVRHEFWVTSAITDAIWLAVETAPLQTGPVTVHLLGPDGRSDLAGRVREGRIPLLPGQSRAGCLLELVDGREQLTRWFTLAANTANAPNGPLRPEGRWVPLRVPADREVRITFTGPGGAVEVDRRGWQGADRVFVATGTTHVTIALSPGRTTTFDAGLAEFVAR